MTKDQKAKELRNYHFSVYSPLRKEIVKRGKCVEIVGIDYPYRKKLFDIRWLEAYLPGKQKSWYWNPQIEGYEK